MPRVLRVPMVVLVLILLASAVHAVGPESVAERSNRQLLVVFDAERNVALVPESTVLPKGFRVFIQEVSKDRDSETALRVSAHPRGALRPLVVGYAEPEVFEAARQQADALGLTAATGRHPVALSQSCTDVLLWIGPNIFHRAINCSGDGSYVLYSYATTRIGTELKNTNVSPYSTFSWYCEPPNEVCTLFTDTAAFGGGAWIRSEAWVEAFYHGHGPDAGESVTYYSAISF